MMKTLVDLIEEHSRKPPVNVEAIIIGLGLELDKKAVLKDSIAGEIALLPGQRYRISANKEDHYFRQRFTLAHELGHYIYHRHLIGDGVDDDKLYRSTEEGNFYNTAIERQHEVEANRFASKLLMPSSAVRSRWSEIQDHRVLAKEFQVSPKAMEIRLQGLGLL